MLLRTVDSWIIDSIFQPVVDWGKNNFDMAKFTFIAISLFGYAMSVLWVVFIKIAEGEIPYMSIIFFLFIVWAGPHNLKKAKARDKEGFAPEERHNPLFMFLRLFGLLMLVQSILDLFLELENEQIAVGYMLVMLSIWMYFNFGACKNNPPAFRKVVPKPV